MNAKSRLTSCSIWQQWPLLTIAMLLAVVNLSMFQWLVSRVGVEGAVFFLAGGFEETNALEAMALFGARFVYFPAFLLVGAFGTAACVIGIKRLRPENTAQFGIQAFLLIVTLFVHLSVVIPTLTYYPRIVISMLVNSL